ncbi:MAG TPA: Hsp20 family protein [Verrucomicrobiae bacterium]|nr:Hsp20 family protein [Verrucomicrobiae bacterium]
MTAQTATAMQPAKTSVVAKQTGTENAIDRFQQVFDSIEKRAFEIFNSNGRWFGRDLSDWLQAESEILHPLHLEIAETEEALTVRAEVPGFTAKELDIRVEGNRLTIAGKHESKEESKKGKTIYSERCANEILRSVYLSSAVDGTKVNATLKDGVLNIELPKAPHAKSVRIEPKAAD